MTDDLYGDYNASYRDWSGTTSAASTLQHPGAALDDFWSGLKARTYKPVDRVAEAIHALSAPRVGESSGSYGTGGAVGAFAPAGPPQRFNINLLGDPQNPVNQLTQGPVGTFFLNSPVQQRGGVVGPGIATAPVNFQNFATYAREGTLSVITSALGHHYQQPDTPFAAPAGPQNTEGLLTNIGQGDWSNVLDNVIDGVSAAGDAAMAPFTALADGLRTAAARSRTQAMRDLIRTGGTIGDPIVRISSLWDQSRFDWHGISARATARGISALDMAAELWDLSPDVVAQIAAKPDMTDEELNRLAVGQPFSYDPGVNLVAELAVGLGPMLAGGSALRGVATALKGAPILGRFVEGASSLEELGLLGRPVATAEKIGSWSLQKAWRVYRSAPFQAAGLVGGFTPAGLKLGAGIRFGEWGLKQAASIFNNQEAVRMMDEWLWETPLSTNPGLNLVNAFSVHPIQSAKSIAGAVRHPLATARGVGESVAKIAGRVGTVAHDVATDRTLAAIRELPIEDLHARIGARLEWDLGELRRVFNPDSPTGLTDIDLKNGLLHIAREIVRDDLGPEARYFEPSMGMSERNAAYVERYEPRAVQLLRDELTGKGTRISDALRDEFWHRSNLIEASELGAEGGIGPYDGTVTLQRLAGWLMRSKQFATIADEALVPALREDINTEFLDTFRGDIRKRYKANEALSARDLNILQTYVPAAIRDESGLLRGRKRVPVVTRRSMEAILDRLERGAQARDLERGAPRTAAVPIIRPEDAGLTKPTALAFRLHGSTIETLERGIAEGPDGLGPLPVDLEAVLTDLYPGVQPAHIRAAPEAYWPQALEWYGRMKESALARGDAIASIDRFERHIDSRTSDGPIDAEALRRIKAAIGHPYSAKEIAANPLLANIVAQRDAALTAFVDRMSAWLDSPLRKLRVRQLPDGERIMLEAEGFGPTDVAILEAAIEKYQRSDVSLAAPLDTTILAPELHPLEKVDALKAALDAGLKLTKVQETRIYELGNLVETYGAAVHDVYGEGTPVTKAVIDKLTTEVANSQDELLGLREEARSLAGLIDRAPSQQISDDLTAFRGRAAALGHVTIGAGKVDIPHWHNLPIEPAGVIAAANDGIRSGAIAAAERNLVSKRAVFEQFDRLANRATGLVGKRLEAAEYVWNEAEPLASTPTKKAALEAAREFQAAGIATRIVKVGSRFKVQRGELSPEAVATRIRATEAIQAAYDAGNIAEGQRLNVEEGVARGGTPESGGAVKEDTMPAPPQTAPEPPSAPEAPPVAVDRGPYTEGVPGSVYERLTADARTPDEAQARKVRYGEGTRWLLADARSDARERFTASAPAGQPPAWIPAEALNGLRRIEAARLGAIDRTGKIEQTLRFDQDRAAKDPAWRREHELKIQAEREIADILVPLAREAVPPPPIVDQIAGQAAADAGAIEAQATEDAARQAAFREHADRYEQARMVPVQEPAVAPPRAATAGDHVLGPDTYATGPKGGDKIGGNPSYRVRTVGVDGRLELAESGPQWKRAKITRTLQPGTVLRYNKAGAVWHVIEPGAITDAELATLPSEAGAAAATLPAPVETTFLDPADNRTPIRSRVVLVDAADVLTSDQIGFPANLQPRSRTVRASSDAQIAQYAADLQPDRLLGTTEGGQGMPLVTPEGAVLAGNGRTAAIRLARDDVFDRYRARVVAEAPQYGFDVSLIDKMRRPMLVRELVDVDPVQQTRLAWQLNEMPLGDLAPSVASAITREDVRQLKVGEEQTLGDALRSPGNATAVARIIEHLPADARTRYFDPKTGVNDQGARLVEGALLSKLLRADDRTLPTFERARAVVFDVVEQGGEEMRRITNGVAEAAGQLLKAQDRAEAGTIGPEILRFSDDLTPALARILELRRTGLNMDGVVTMLDNVTAFDEATINPLQTQLAKVLASSTSQKEIRTFIRAVARAADAGDEGVMPMFEEVRTDYSGVLNDGLRAWNRIRAEAGKAELDPFPNSEYPYDVPLTSTVANRDGSTLPPIVATQPLAAEEVGPAIAARTLGEEVHAVAETIDQLPDGASAALLDPNEQALYDFIAADPEGAPLELTDAIETTRAYEGLSGGSGLPGHFEGLLAAANEGTIRPGDWYVLRHLAGGLIRKDVSGRYNMTLVEHTDPQVGRYSPMSERIMGMIERVVATRGERPEGAAAVVGQHPQLPVTPEELAADVGPDVPFDTNPPMADALAQTSGHVVTTNENPSVERAVRRAAGAPVAGGQQRRILEFNAPDAAVQAERLSALRQQAASALEEAQRQRAAAETNPLPDPEVTSVFPDDELRGMWDRLMRSGVDPIAQGIGSAEPRSLAALDDAVESIDRGMYVDPVSGVGLTEAEAGQLKSYLLRVMNGTVETALARRGGRQAAAFVARVKPPDDFALSELQERAKAIMDEVGQRIVRDPTANPLEGWEGTQYIPSPLPTLSKAPGTPLAPRLVLRDAFADVVIPGIAEELGMGRMESVGRRVETSRASRTIGHIMGPRPEKAIRARAVENFKAELHRMADSEALPAGEAKKVDQVADRAFELWRDHIENVKLGGFQIYRRINLMGPEQMNRLFAKALEDVYGSRQPTWVADMAAVGENANRLWRRADNRLRNYILESGVPLSHALEALYGGLADRGERPGRWVTVAYHIGRFLLDTRWLGLEAGEGAILALSEGGIKPLLEGSALTRPGGPIRRGAPAPKEPIGIGKTVQAAMWREFAHFTTALSDTSANSGMRMRYLMRVLAQKQTRPFRDAVLDMAKREPELVRMIREQGDTADQFVARLDRDWQLAEQGQRTFGSTAEAERAFKPWLDGGFIDQATFKEYVKARKYTVHPAIEAELSKVVGDPLATALYTRLAEINHGLFHDLTQTFFGQTDRSNLQRALNHPLLYWPISYQLKATKWMLGFMLDNAFGVDTGAAGGAVIQQVWDAQRRRIQDDPEYRRRLVANSTLFFLASMLLPITPTDIGVSMSPWLRMLVDEDYRRAGGIFGWGPFYSYISAAPRLVAEQSKPGGFLENSPIRDRLQQAFPQMITVGGPKRQPPATSQIDAEARRIAGPDATALPVQQPDYPRLP